MVSTKDSYDSQTLDVWPVSELLVGALSFVPSPVRGVTSCVTTPCCPPPSRRRSLPCSRRSAAPPATLPSLRSLARTRVASSKARSTRGSTPSPPPRPLPRAPRPPAPRASPQPAHACG